MTTPAPAAADLANAQPSPGTSGKLERLKALLGEMFQLDRGDFGFWSVSDHEPEVR